MSIDSLVRKALSSSVAFAKECIKKPVLYSALALGFACGGSDSRSNPVISLTDAAVDAAADASSDGSRYDGPGRMKNIEKDMIISGNDAGRDMYVGNDIYSPSEDEGVRARTDGAIRADVGVRADASYFPDAAGDASAYVRPDGRYLPDAGNPDAGRDAGTDAHADLGGDAAPDAAPCLRSLYFFDSDGDGHGDLARPVFECEPPEGYVGNASDCDDTDRTRWRWVFGYADNDGDRFGVGEAVPVCAGDSLPAGYAANNTDCNDGIGSIHPGAFEYCNTLDDNCDGGIDEGYALSDACDNGLLGECFRSGEYHCSADGLREECSAPSVERSVEECDGLDNDCDGTADNNLTALSQDCFAGIGECRRSGIEYQVCEGIAGWSADYRNCDAVAGTPSEEVCDGLDNDCDRTVDNNLTALSQECFTGIGECRRGGLEYQVCEGNAGWSADYRNCDAVAGAAGEEVCDGLDNDCDGIEDNALAAPSQECYTGIGECGRTGLEYQVCEGNAGWSADYRNCDAVAGAPSVELCNGLDDDCDDLFDEGVLITFYADADGDGFGDIADFRTGCLSLMGYVTNADDCDDRPAGGDAVNPLAAELCDGIDNNCAGGIDESYAGGEACDNSLLGDCFRTGERVCAESGLEAVCNAPIVEPGTVQCNGLDNDCDGEVDCVRVDTGRIFYSSDVSGNYELYSIASDGSDDPINLTNSPAYDIDPAISPDGTRVLFTSNRDSGFQMYILTLATEELDRLTAGERGSWAPDGRQVAYGNGDIIVFDLETRTENIISNPPLRNTSPTFSPDGTRIAYMKEGGICAGQCIVIRNSDGSGEEEVLTNGMFPAWNPISDDIVYSAAGGGELFVVPADGSLEPRSLGAGTEEPTWSPDGRLIAYTLRTGNLDIYIKDAETGEDLGALVETSGNDRGPHWSN